MSDNLLRTGDAGGGRAETARGWLAHGLVPGVIVVAATLIATLGVLWGGFVNWDDGANIIDNSRVHGLDGGRLAWMWASRHLGVYEPLSWMLKAATYSIFGLKPAAFHAVSWVLHGVCAGLAYFLIRRLVLLARPGLDATSATWGAAVGALLFSVHPLRVECVGWASGQSYLLAAAFGMASVLAYLRASAGGTGRGFWIVLSWLLFVAALLSKAAVVPLPLVLLLLDIYPLRWRIAGPVWAETFAFAVPAILVGGYVMATPIVPMVGGAPPGLWARIVFGMQGAGMLLAKTVWPSELSPFYQMPPALVWSARVVALVAASGLAIVIALTCWRRWPGLACATATFLVMVAPTLGIVRHGEQLTADRYSYLACLGFAAVLAGAIAMAGPILQRVSGVAIIGLALLSWRQASFWSDSGELWRHALAVDSKNWVAHNNLASVLLDAGKTDEAKSHANAAVGLHPDYPDAWMTLGMIVEREEKPEQALALYERAVAIRSWHPAANNLGAVLLKQGRGDEAIAIYEAALRGDPSSRELRNNLAAAKTKARKYLDAEKLLVGLMVEEPGDAVTRLNLGKLYVRAGKPQFAEEQFRKLIATNPTSGEAHLQLGLVLLATQRRDEARAEFQRCIEVDPAQVNARAQLAVLMEQDGEIATAVRLLDEANKIDPADTRVSNKLAWILATTSIDELRDAQRAEGLARGTSERLQNRIPQALDTLAAALAAEGKFDEAVAAAEAAARLAMERDNEALVKKIGERLERYRQQKAWVEQATARVRKPGGAS